MDYQTNVATVQRRTREEIRQIVAELATSGIGFLALQASSLSNHPQTVEWSPRLRQHSQETPLLLHDLPGRKVEHRLPQE